MKITFDPKKNQKNIEERGLSFEHIADFDFESAMVWEDTRKEYPERRIAALGNLNGRIHFLCFSRPETGVIRVISFCKANKREVEKYGKFKEKQAADH